MHCYLYCTQLYCTTLDDQLIYFSILLHYIIPFMCRFVYRCFW